MVKGKYAARSANREAARDNVLIAEKIDQIAELQNALKRAQDELKEERSQRSAIIVSRASEQSAKEIALMKQELADARTRHSEINENTAEWIVDYIKGLSEDYPDLAFIPMPGIRDILVDLVGDARTTHFLANLLEGQKGVGNRKWRRRGNSGITADRAIDGRECESSRRQLTQKIKKITVDPDQPVDGDYR